MATSRSIIREELEKHELPKHKMYLIIIALSQLLEPKKEFEDLEKNQIKTEADMTDMLRMMCGLQEKIVELQKQITNNKGTGSSITSDSSSDLSTDQHQFNIETGNNSENVKEKEDTESVMVMKRLQIDLGENEKHIQENEREHNLLKTQIDRIKVKLGLTAKASMEELDAKIDELCRKGLKEADNYKKQLLKARTEIEELQDIKYELEQEKSLLQRKLQRKEKEMERQKSKREAQRTIDSCDKYLQPHTKQAQLKQTPMLSVATKKLLPRQPLTGVVHVCKSMTLV